MHEIKAFYHTKQTSGFYCVILYTNSKVTVQRCYIIRAVINVFYTFRENIRGGIS